MKRKSTSLVYIVVEHDKSDPHCQFSEICSLLDGIMLGEAGTPRPGTPSSVHSGELPATRVR